MDMQKNTIKLEDGKVIKHFAAHTSFVTENAIYEKLKGTKLVPKVIYSGQDTIEHEYIDGERLFDRMVSHVLDPVLLAKDFDMFFQWYKLFYGKIQTTLSNIDFRKFVVSGDDLYCVDLEHCKKGYYEDDFAKLLSQMALVPKPFCEDTRAICTMFAMTANKYFDINQSRFSGEIKKELQRLCKLLDVFYSDEKAKDFLRSIFSEELLQDTYK